MKLDSPPDCGKHNECLRQIDWQRDHLPKLFPQMIADVQQEERQSIARELHDHLGQEMLLIKMKAMSLAEQLALPFTQDGIRELVALIDRAQRSLNRITINFTRPAILDDMILSEAMTWLAADYERHTAISCIVDVPVDLDPPDAVATAAYRILQEALTNACKHASASVVQVSVRMNMTGDNMILTVSDNGRGFHFTGVPSQASQGLMHMQKRARLVGGVLRIHGRHGQGTRVIAHLPVQIMRPASKVSSLAMAGMDHEQAGS